MSTSEVRDAREATNGNTSIMSCASPGGQVETSVPVLPSRPAGSRPVNIGCLGLDDGDLSGVPVPFILNRLRSVAAEIMHGADCVRPIIPPGDTLPNELLCTISHPSPFLLLPSHILAIRAATSAQGLIVPVYGLPWALQSPVLHFLSSTSTPSPTPPDPNSTRSTVTLPVVEIELPTIHINALHEWIYTGNSTRLLSSLTSFPNPIDASHASSIQLRIPPPPPLRPETQSAAVLLDRLREIQGTWQNYLALEIDEEVVWEAMEEAWRVIMDAYRRVTTLGERMPA